ncbi:MAG: hypothetical protein K8J08_09740 [Thermoanaerobaculia bacterium]|nr:hypothetical protein [Thermoanaerobaculia bacterium]
MTLAEKGTGGAQGVYMKFEPGFSGDPMAKIEQVASKYEGSPAASSVRHGITWTSTRYTYSGVTQTMNMTAHGGFSTERRVSANPVIDSKATDDYSPLPERR